MKRPMFVPEGRPGWEMPAPRQPELEEALFEIGEVLVGETRLKDLIDSEADRRELEETSETNREALREMGAYDLLGDIIEEEP